MDRLEKNIVFVRFSWINNFSIFQFFQFVPKIVTSTAIETWSSQSTKIDKSDLIDIDCIDQSVEIDDTLVSFIDLFLVGFTDFIDLHRKIYLFICSSKNENWFHAGSKFVDNWVAIDSGRIKQLSLFKKIFLKILKNLVFPTKTRFKIFFWFVGAQFFTI